MQNNKIKSVYIIPPKWYCLNPPSFLIPTVSCLREYGFDTKMIDLNIDFYLSLLNRESLEKAFTKAEKQFPLLFDYLRTHFVKGKKENDYDDEFKEKLLKYNKIKEFTVKKKEEVQRAINSCEHSLNVMRNKELFYNQEELIGAIRNIDFCLEVASRPFFPAQIQLLSYQNLFFKLDLNCMIKSAKTENLFTEFYEKNILSHLGLQF